MACAQICCDPMTMAELHQQVNAIEFELLVETHWMNWLWIHFQCFELSVGNYMGLTKVT